MKNISEFVNKIICGDSLTELKKMPDESIDCCISSPPYWGLRDYQTAKWEGGDINCEHINKNIKQTFHKGQPKEEEKKSRYISVCGKCGAKRIDAQLGLEKTPEEYVAKMVEVFHEIKRILKKQGTCWLNLGDSYVSAPIGHKSVESVFNSSTIGMKISPDVLQGAKFDKTKIPGLKPKDLIGIPWRVAFALQQDGWYLRQDIIWAKPNPMPESVKDRCTKAHEYIFLLTKSPRYYFNNEAIREQPKMKDIKELGGVSNYNNGKRENKNLKYAEIKGANKRSVWTINTKSFREAHFATFPENLIKPMVLAGCPKEVCNKCGKARKRITEQPEWEKHQSKGMAAQDYEGNPMYRGGSHNDGLPYRSKTKEMVGFTDCGCNAGWSAGIVFDPFMGAGTTALTAKNLKRNYVGIELNPSYIKMAEKRLRQEILL